MSNNEGRVHMCKISQLITDPSDSWRTLFYWLVYHMMFFPPLSRHPGFPSCNLAKVGWRKWYRYTTRFMRDSLPFASVFTEYIDSHQGALSFSIGLQKRSPSTRCQRKGELSSSSLLTGANWEPNTKCIPFKPLSSSLPSCYKTRMDNLGHNQRKKKSWDNRLQ